MIFRFFGVKRGEGGASIWFGEGWEEGIFGFTFVWSFEGFGPQRRETEHFFMSFGVERAEALEVFIGSGTASLRVLITFGVGSLLAPLRMRTGLGLGRDFFLVSARTPMFPLEALVASAGTLPFSPEASVVSARTLDPYSIALKQM